MYAYYGHDYGAAPDPGVRAADTDREATAERLRHHHAEGRIDVIEFQSGSTAPTGPRPSASWISSSATSRAIRSPDRWSRSSSAAPVDVPVDPALFLVIDSSALAGHHHAGLWVLIPLFVVARFLFWGHRPGRPRRYQSPYG